MAGTEIIGGGNIEPRALEDEMRSAYLDYAMSVIVSRALPDVRDGLKPVHRRVLFSMNENGLTPARGYVKCASVVGDVMGRYHPHGDSAIYDTLDRRRPGRGHALHRGAAHAHRDGDAARPRPGHGRLRAQLRRTSQRAARPA